MSVGIIDDEGKRKHKLFYKLKKKEIYNYVIKN